MMSMYVHAYLHACVCVVGNSKGVTLFLLHT